MIRLTLVSAVSLLLLACGSTPKRGAADPRVAVPLVDGDAIYRLRYNPPPCLADRPELHVEVETPAGWERVALESAEVEPDLVIALLTRFGREPRAVLPVQADLTGATRAWAGGHVARILRIQLIDPVLPPDESDEPDEPEEPAPTGEEPEPPAQSFRAASRHSTICASPGTGRNPHIPATHPHSP